jgi:tetratricopeptide (TPR) repeat protein
MAVGATHGNVWGVKIDDMLAITRRTMLLFPAVAVLLASVAWAGSGQNPKNLDRAFQAALADYNAGNFAAAAEALVPLARQSPDNFDVEELLGLAYSAQGEDAEASPHLEKAVRLKPSSASARCNLAVNLAKLGKTGPAELEFKKSLELDPKNVETNHDLGEFYIRAGNIKAAIPYLAQAERLEPAAYDNGYDLALAYEQTRQWKLAQAEIQRLISKKDTAELHNLLGEVDEGAGDYVAAANEYERAAHADPSESNLFDWGSELLLHHTMDPAVQVFTDGLGRYPGSARLAVGLGLAYFLRSNYDDSVRALLKGIDLEPGDARAYYFLSKAYDMSPSQADEVIRHFERYAERQPRDARAAFYYGMSLWKGKRSENSDALLGEVESLLKKSAALDPAFPDAPLQLGNLYSQEHRYGEAVPAYLAALGLDPNIPDAHYRLGQAYVHLGKKDLADKEFQLHQQLYQKHLAEVDEQRSRIRQFIVSAKGDHAGS